MKSIRSPLILMTAIMAMATVHAQDAVPATNPSTPLAEELVSLMHFEKNFDPIKGKLGDLMAKQKPANIPQDVWDRISKKTQDAMDAVIPSMTWEKMRPIYVSLYAETFSPEELQGLIAFYKTPVGQKWIERQPQLQTAIMEKSQVVVMDIMPPIMNPPTPPSATGSSIPIQTIPSGTPTPTPSANRQ